MPLPPDLEFHQRIAKYPDGAIFLCHRKGHKKLARRFDHESDASEFRAAHDVAFHNSILRHVGFEPARNVQIEPALTDFLAHVRRLEIEGARSHQTTRHYETCCDRLRRACRSLSIRTAHDLTPERISEIVRWFRTNTKTKGSLTVKALSALKGIIKWKGSAAEWKIPHDEIRPEQRTKLDLDGETIRRIVSAMPAGSVEEASAYLKARSGARDVEITSAEKEHFDLDVSIELDGRKVKIGIFRPPLHDKGGRRRAAPRRHVYVITSDAVEKVRPFVERAKPGARVFVDKDGRPMTYELMRAKIRAAAKRAGFVKLKRDALKKKPVKIGAIDSLAQIRAEVITVVEEESSLAEAALHIGHRDPATTLRWYLKDRLTLRKIAEKYRPAEIIANAIPLRYGVPKEVQGARQRRGNKRKLESVRSRRVSHQRARIQ